MQASSLENHLEVKHGIFKSEVINMDFLVEDREPVNYVAETFTDGLQCPVEGSAYQPRVLV